MIIEGTVIRVYGDDISTDIIFPSEAAKKERVPEKLGPYAFFKFEGDRKTVPSKFYRDAKKLLEGGQKPIVVGGYNFGCGSSREDAVYTLKHSGVIAVIATSFPDIFYRNAYNNGFAAIICRTRNVNIGDELKINLDEGRIVNVSEDEIYNFSLTENEKKLIRMGGVYPIMKRFLRKKLSGDI